MDDDTRDLLAKSLRHVLADASDRPLGERLADLGWDEVVADDRPGALRVLFETKGELVAGADALGPLLAAAVADAAGDAALASSAVVLPASLHPDRPSSRLEGDRLVIDGIATAVPADGSILVVPVAAGGVDWLRLAVVPKAGTTAEAVGGVDADVGLHRVRGEVDAAGARWVDGAWDEMVAVGRWALAAELVGIGRVVLADTVEYTKERRQYGRPIGSFQALQQRVASAHATIVGASHVVAEAASSGDPWAALVAKALAGHAAEDCCTQAQQCYGAIGFTWEHGFHRALRRTYVLDRMLGGWRALEAEIGARLLATREVPKIGTL